MVKRGEKSGQFYLVAAIIISMIVISLVVLSNYARGETHTNVNDIKEELYIESRKTINYGESQGYSQAQFNNLFAGFSGNYVDHFGGEKSIYFLFGNINGVTVTGYQEEAKTVILRSGTQNTTVTNVKGDFTANIAPQSSKQTLSIDGVQYDFLMTGEPNIFFIISDIMGGSEYIARG